MVTKNMILKGRVQGVGMRFFVREEARIKQLKGYVKNLSDGTVFICVHGPEDTVKHFKNTLLEEAPGHIDDIIESNETTNDFPEPFEVHL